MATSVPAISNSELLEHHRSLDDTPDATALSPASFRKPADSLTSRVLLYSFVAAVGLAISGFAVVATYLLLYLHHGFTAFDTTSMTQLSVMDQGKLQAILLARAGLWKFILQSCGIISGVVFGFLGFGLFLLGVKGDMDALVDDSHHKVQLSRMAPGSFVLFIAAVLIGVCSTKEVKLTFGAVTTSTDNAQDTSAPSDTSIPDLNNIPPADLPNSSSAGTKGAASPTLHSSRARK